jgi:hypothetical protein
MDQPFWVSETCMFFLRDMTFSQILFESFLSLNRRANEQTFMREDYCQAWPKHFLEG